jgi:pimeloyl-ACP methyl ester carboxylesterase
MLATAVACASAPVKLTPKGGRERSPWLDAVEPLARGDRPNEAEAYRAGVWDPAYFDALLASDELEIEGLRYRHRREGVGIPLIGLRIPSGEDPSYYPPEGITRPVTAVTRRNERGEASIWFLDPVVHKRISGDDGTTPLAADFTAPYALLVSRTLFARTEITGTLRHEEIDPQAGIFLLERYSPEKIPLLMIHGLLSSPLTWRELTNAVFGDDELRDRYQVWHAIYPTGIPYLHAAADLRDQFLALRQQLDPEGDDFATNQVVVVAHSMGGLLAKTLVASSGDRIWRQAFTVPPEELEASPEDRARVQRFLFFDRDPTVRLGVFIATPHRGSQLAENPLSRLLASWIALPGDKADPFERVLRDNEDRLAPGFRVHLAGLPNGPRALSNLDPLIGSLGELPVDPAVPFHTIVGQKEPDLFSDGVVDHASSHQSGAASELVVEGAGHSVHRSEAAIEEVMRILREHVHALERSRVSARTEMGWLSWNRSSANHNGRFSRWIHAIWSRP